MPLMSQRNQILPERAIIAALIATAGRLISQKSVSRQHSVYTNYLTICIPLASHHRRDTY